MIDRSSSPVEDEDIGANEYPFDPSRIEITSNQVSIFNIVERLKNREINLSPEFQRNPDLWRVDVQSRLVESLILGIPLQAFYFDVQRISSGQDVFATIGKRDCWNVVDGLQRLSSIRNFIIGGQRLKGLEYLKTLNGKTFDELPPPIRRSILESTILVYLIKEGTPEDIKFNIFKRVNTGGMPLTQQEIRHALFNGKGTALLARLADAEQFKRVIHLGGSRRMTDREFLNRFLAFYLLDMEESYKSMDTFLNDSLRYLNQMSDKDIGNVESVALSSLQTIERMLKENAFRRFNSESGDWSSQVNKALFEVEMVGVAKLSADCQARLVGEPSFEVKFKLLFQKKMDDGLTFDQCINKSTGDRKRVLRRHKIFSSFLNDILEA